MLRFKIDLTIDLAARNGHTTLVEFLIEKDPSPIGALLIAAEYDQAALLEVILSRYPRLNCCSQLIIHRAARYGSTAVAQLLLKRDAYLINTFLGDNQPIHVAATNYHQAFIDFLLRQDYSLILATNKRGLQPIGALARAGYYAYRNCSKKVKAMIEFLLDKGATINAPDLSDDELGLDYGVSRELPDSVQRWTDFFLINGADVNVLNAQGESPLQRALQPDNNRRKNLVTLLIECGARIHKEDEGKLLEISIDAIDLQKEQKYLKSLSPGLGLKIASGQGLTELVQMILTQQKKELVASPWRNDYIEALLGASTGGHTRVVSLLRDHMSDDEALKDHLKDALKRSLRRSAAHGRSGLVGMLIEQSGNQFDVNDYAEALTAAAIGGHVEVVRTLRQQIANDAEILPSTLARALIRAASHRRFNVIDYLIDAQNEIIAPIAPAGRILQNILRPYSDEQITADPRLQDYQHILHMLADTQRFLIARRDRRLLNYVTEVDVASHDDESLPEADESLCEPEILEVLHVDESLQDDTEITPEEEATPLGLNYFNIIPPELVVLISLFITHSLHHNSLTE